MPNRVVVLADPGQSDASERRAGDEDWPKVKNYQLPEKYVSASNPGRVCFWREIMFSNVDPDTPPVVAPEVFSVAEFPRSDQIFGDTALLIINWDAANGDPLYRADVTLAYLQTRGRVPIGRFLNGGGVALIESQTAQSRPVQESYDAIFDRREVTVSSVSRYEHAAGAEAYVIPGALSHPVVSIFNTDHVGIEASVTNRTNIFVNVPEEIRGAPGLRGSDGNINQMLWFGWFTDWTVDWMPLLYVRVGGKERYPVLLSKAVGNGLVLVSTMWLSLAQTRLSARIAEVARSEKLRKEAIALHRHVWRRRRAIDTLLGLLAAGALVAAGAAFVEVARSARHSWILAALGIGAIGFSTSTWKLFLRIWARPLRVPPWKTFGFAKRRVGKKR